MSELINVRIVTPDGVAYEAQAKLVSLPTPEGTVGIMAHHAPMLCAVAAGKARFVDDAGAEESRTVGSGVAHVGNNEVTLLVDSAE